MLDLKSRPICKVGLCCQLTCNRLGIQRRVCYRVAHILGYMPDFEAGLIYKVGLPCQVEHLVKSVPPGSTHLRMRLKEGKFQNWTNLQSRTPL
jgi:hypothetical protein